MEFRGKVGTPSRFLHALEIFADFSRDVTTPQQYSLTRVRIAFDQHLAWSKTEAFLQLLAGARVRIRDCDVLSTPSKDYDLVGVPVTLERTGSPHVRQPPPGPLISISGPVDAATFRGLVAALFARPPSPYPQGVRVDIAPDLSVEDAFAFLERLSGYVSGPILVAVAPPGSPAGVRLLGNTVTPRPGSLPPLSARTIRLALPW